MKVLFSFLLLISFSVRANPLMNTKERLRLHLWVYGITEQPAQKNKPKEVPLPEELHRALKKI